MLKDNVQAKANTHHVVDIVTPWLIKYKLQVEKYIYGLNTHYWARSTKFMSWPVLSRTHVLKAPFALSRVLLDLGTKFCNSSKTWRGPIFTTSSPHQQPPTCLL